ncbi:hypothetical protein [Paenibacillus arenilitoris]|uniref:Uncharacterized protein n=1 Tax=Paenibacillus arenilitoris TaxID=2772299 RepID=A0A927CPP1_9BACL|nr:hypothetical protein [Paenibacillus arenilitoris]MBD2869651.1 hypothetical protein [Paenibacillus arenilitoris]
MKVAKPLLAACLTAIAVMLIWGMLPLSDWEHPARQSEVAVFRSTPAVKLTNNNLVDVLIGAQLNERLEKAEWRSGVLSVDMKVNAKEGRPSAWFGDAAKLIRVSFAQLENVRRVLIRIVEEREEGSVLLAAVDVRKTDGWLIREMDELAHADPVHDELWRSRLRVSFTSAWEALFGPPAGFSVHPAAGARP